MYKMAVHPTQYLEVSNTFYNNVLNVGELYLLAYCCDEYWDILLLCLKHFSVFTETSPLVMFFLRQTLLLKYLTLVSRGMCTNQPIISKFQR